MKLAAFEIDLGRSDLGHIQNSVIVLRASHRPAFRGGAKFRPELRLGPRKEIVGVVKRAAVPDSERGPGAINRLLRQRCRGNGQTGLG